MIADRGLMIADRGLMIADRGLMIADRGLMIADYAPPPAPPQISGRTPEYLERGDS